MNILPKKSWHVRTKNNIARVRRDEKKAADEEKETQRRIALAAQEARTALLRERASKRLTGASSSSLTGRDDNEDHEDETEKKEDSEESNSQQDMRFGIALGSLKDVVQPDGHVNFFQDVEAGKRQGGVNEEFEEEQKKEQEDYEKKIGYLVYLGQDSLEHSKTKPWYSKIDRNIDREGLGLRDEVLKQQDLDFAAGEIGGLEEKSKNDSISAEAIKMTKFKNFLDPLKDIRSYLSTPGVKKKVELPSGSAKSKAIAQDYRPDKKDDKHKKYDEKLKKGKKRKRSHSHSSSHKKSKKSKKHKKHSSKSKRKGRRSSDSYPSNSSDSAQDSEEELKREKLAKLRAERLEREREERRKANQVLAKLRGEEEPPSSTTATSSSSLDKNQSFSAVKQKYNSQFNPHLARQNYE